MIHINLLPNEFAQARAKKEQQILFGGLAGILLVVLVGFWAIKKQQLASLENKIVKAEAELNRYKTIVSQIKSIEKNKASLQKKRDVITNLNRSRLVYPVFLEDLLPIIPSDVWVNNIRLKEKGQTIAVKMDSRALSNFALASWLTNLDRSTHFNGVELGAISYQKQSGQETPTLNFSISCNYRHKGPLPLEEFF